MVDFAPARSLEGWRRSASLALDADISSYSVLRDVPVHRLSHGPPPFQYNLSYLVSVL